jgi:hypothetical protein
VGLIAADTPVGIKGRFRFATFEKGELADERIQENMLVTGGLGILAAALNWAFIQNQNAGWGGPYSAVNLGDAWGAVGTSTTPAAAAQTALLAEIGRAIISNGSQFANNLSYDFFFGLTQANGSISEVGMFAQANLITTTLSSGLTSGSPYSALPVVATPADIPSGSIVIVGYGSGQTQSWITTSDSPPASVSIAVTTQNANATYPAGTVVAYLPGTMIDRTVFITPIVKTNTQTAILEVQLTLVTG